MQSDRERLQPNTQSIDVGEGDLNRVFFLATMRVLGQIRF